MDIMFLAEGSLASQWGWGVWKFGLLAERHATSLVHPSDSVSPTHRLIPGVENAIVIERPPNAANDPDYTGIWQINQGEHWPAT